MRRGTLFGLAVLVVLLGAYAVYWFVAAGRIENGVAAWAESLRRENAELTWRTIRVRGFPFAFDVRLSDARLRTAKAPGGELRAPTLSASAGPWNFHDWRLSAPDGLTAIVGSGSEPSAKIDARAAAGAVGLGNGDMRIWLTLADASAELPEHVSAETAHLWAIVPQKRAKEHTDRALGLAADLHGLRVPLLPAAFQGTIDDFAFGTTVLGAFPSGPPSQAAAAWRDSGGTIELDRFSLRWGEVAVNGSGTLALDQTLQPMGAFSGAVSGLDQLLKAFAEAGRLRMGDLTLARLGLAALARPGPNGKPEISASFTIQDGQMFLGPLKLGPVPRIKW